MNKQIIKILPYIIIVFLIIYLFFNSNYRLVKNEPQVQIDSTKVTKVIQSKTGSFNDDKPQPIVIVVPSQNTPQTTETSEILNLIKSLQVTQADQQKLLDIIAKKTYSKVYENDTVKIEVKNTVENGKKTNEIVNWQVKESFINYFEKTHTYKLKPKFALSTGLGFDTRLDSLANPQLKAVLGFKNKNGYELQFGYSTDKRASILLKKDLFVRYGR